MNTAVRRAAVVVGLVVLSVACGDSGPTSPIGPSQPSVVPSPIPPPPPRTFPPLSGQSRTYVFDRELLHPVADYTRNSRFVLFENGAFVLRYPVGDYRGEYTETNGVITFEWEGWSSAGSWGATGTLRGDSLTVQYNLIMQLTDFEDAVYVLTR